MLASLRDQVIAYLKQHWLTLLLLSGLIGSLLESLAAATWYPDAEPLVVLALIGIGYGSLLAVSRFRWRTAILISVTTSIGLVLILIGRMLPAPPVLISVPLTESLQLMNLRLLALFEQIEHGGLRLLIVGFGLLVWQAGVWLMWSIARSRRALSGVLWCALPMVINLSASGKAASLSMVFMTSGVVLVARTAYLDHLHDWKARRIGYPELIAEDWSLGVVIISVLVLCLGGLSMPEWRASLERFFQSLRPAVVVQPAVPRPAISNSPLPTSFVPDLTVVGDPIPPDSNATLFWVHLDDPAPRVGQGGVPLPPDRIHYWRGGIFGAYTGRGWEPIEASDQPRPGPAATTAPPGRYVLHQHFNLVALHSDQLFAVNDPITATVALRSIGADASALLRGNASVYDVTSWATSTTVNQLDADKADEPTDYPANIRTVYLQLPDSIPQRVRDLTRNLTASAHSPYDKAVRIQNYLRTTYRYRLDVPPPPAGRDIVDYFLFDAPGGFCSYYASAMVVMLRLTGVPARVVTGYAMGDYDLEGRAYRVPASAAHAWVEVYFPAYGWVEFEPTTSQAVFLYRTDEVPTPQPAAAATPSPSLMITVNTDVIVIGGVIIGMLGLIGAGVIVQRRRAWQQRPSDQQARELYWRMRRALSTLDVRAPASVTPIEFMGGYLHPIDSVPRLQEAVQHICDLYVAATFTAKTPERARIQAVRQAWQRTWFDRVRVRWRQISRALHR